MALINNQAVYPIKPNPQSTDFFVGTDSEDEGKTVSFSIAAVQSAVGATIYTNSNTIPEPRAVTHVDQMNFIGNSVNSEFLAQHTNGHILRVNQEGIFGTSLGIGTLTNTASAALQIDSTTKGFLPPRMTETQRDGISSPATGLAVFNTTSGFLEYYNGTSWVTNTNTNIYNSNGIISGGARELSGESNTILSFNLYNTNSSNWTTRGRSQISSIVNVQGYEQGDGFGGVLASQLITINGSAMSVLDQINSKGLEYAADYSSNYTVRSLVDKAYVDSVAGAATIYTADGNLSGDRTIKGLNGNRLVYQSFDLLDSNFNTATLITASSTTVKISSQIGTGSGALDTERGISLGPAGMIVGDSTSSKGLEYAADYSANYTARSLVDKDYVDGVTGATYYNSDGTIDSTTRTVLGTNNSILIHRVNDLLPSTFLSKTEIRWGGASMVQTLDRGSGSGVVTGQMGFSANLAAYTIIDSINNKGMVYAADYSANYTARSIVDKGFIESRIPQINSNFTGWADYVDTEHTSGSPQLLAASTPTRIKINSLNIVDSQKPDDVPFFYYAKQVNISGVTGAFELGEILTGGTSGATGTIVEINPSYIRLNGISAINFSDTETVTGGTSGASATVNGTPVEGGKITGRNGDALMFTLDLKATPTNAGTETLEIWLDIGGGVGELYRRIITFPKGSGVERPVSFTTGAYTLNTWESNGAEIWAESNNLCSIYEARVVCFRVHKARI